MIASVLVLRQLETLYTSLSESLEAEARAGAGARRTTVPHCHRLGTDLVICAIDPLALGRNGYGFVGCEENAESNKRAQKLARATLGAAQAAWLPPRPLSAGGTSSAPALGSLDFARSARPAPAPAACDLFSTILSALGCAGGVRGLESRCGVTAVLHADLDSRCGSEHPPLPHESSAGAGAGAGAVSTGAVAHNAAATGTGSGELIERAAVYDTLVLRLLERAMPLTRATLALPHLRLVGIAACGAYVQGVALTVRDCAAPLPCPAEAA